MKQVFDLRCSQITCGSYRPNAKCVGASQSRSDLLCNLYLNGERCVPLLAGLSVGGAGEPRLRLMLLHHLKNIYSSIMKPPFILGVTAATLRTSLSGSFRSDQIYTQEFIDEVLCV